MLTTITLSSKHQMTLPKRVVEMFGLQAGDQLAVSVRKRTGEIVLRPRTGDLTKLFGTLSDVKIPVGKTLDDLIDQARDEYLAEKFRRIGFFSQGK